MKRKSLYIFLGLEAILSIILYFIREALPNAFTTIMAFPFEQIALGLRALSLSGKPGNLIAIALYIAVCLLPVFVMLLIRKKRNLLAEDSLLAILSPVLFAVIYVMINPGVLSGFIRIAQRGSFLKPLLGCIAYSVLSGYILIRILRLFYSADTIRLQKYLVIMLYMVNILIVYLIFGAQFYSLMDSFEALRAGNKGNESLLGTSYIFLVLKYIVEALPNLLIILVVTYGQKLLTELSIDRYSNEAVSSAQELSRICGLALVIAVLSNIGFNLLQLVFIKSLLNVNTLVDIPVLSIAFVLVGLLFAQFIKENKKLKEDNDMFI